jgi:cathepsin F
LLTFVLTKQVDEMFIHFQKFVLKYGKTYSSIEETLAKYETFKNNLKYLVSSSYNDKLYLQGVTKFSDLTKQEFRAKYLTLRPAKTEFRTHSDIKLPLRDLPDNFDWRKQGAVGPVKNQGQCGSCWAFSTVGNLEGLYAIKHGKLIQFSEQQLLDCDTVDSACGGGEMRDAMDYIKGAGGLEREEVYPYTADRGTCQFNVGKAVVQVKDHIFKDYMDEEELRQLWVQNGPLAIGYNADNLQFYTGGIMDDSEEDGDPSQLNHGVVLVGFGVENNTQYWIVKNSWAADWGEEGYYRVLRGKGICGINKEISTAIIE